MASHDMLGLFAVLEANHAVVPLRINAALEEFDSVQNSNTGLKGKPGYFRLIEIWKVVA